MKLSITFKIGLLTFFLSSLGIFTIAYLSINKTADIVYKQELDNIVEDLSREKDILKMKIDTMVEDVHFLSKTPPISGIIRASKHKGYDPDGSTPAYAWKQRLGKIFSSILENRDYYKQIRFIGVADKGREILRAERNQKIVVIDNRKRLQQKKHRYYMTDTLKLKEGEIYFSKVDLNREHGKIELPHTLTIRIATPIYDETSNKPFGIVIINADFNKIAEGFDQKKMNGNYFIANRNGEYLLNHDPKKEYQFEFGRSYRIYDDFKIKPSEIANLHKKGAYKFITIPKNNLGVLIEHLHYNNGKIGEYLFVGFVDDNYYIFESTNNIKSKIILIALSVSFAISLLIAFGVYLLTQPISILKKRVDRIADGEEDVEIPDLGSDEIGSFANSMRGMIKNIEKSEVGLRELAESLEAKVEERTKALAESEMEQKAILISAPDTIIRINVDGKILTSNPAATSIFGYTEEEFMTMHIDTIIPSGMDSITVDGYVHELNSWNDDKLVSITETEGITKRGNKIPIAYSVSEYFINHERNYILIIRDITEQKKNEKSLRQLSNAIEQTADMVVITDIKGTIEYVNPAFETILGYTKYEAIGENLRVLKSGKHYDDFYKNMWETINLGHVWQGSLINKTKSGELINEEMTISPILDSVGVITNFVAIKKDITGQKKVEMALAESERKFRNLFESSGEAIMLLNDKGFIDCNDATLNIFGYNDREEFMGKHPADLSPPVQADGRDSKESADEKIAAAFRDGKNFFEWTHCRADGEEFTADVLLMPTVVKGERVLQAIVRDITERKLAEEMLAKSEERYRTLIENTNVVAWEYDWKKQCFTFVSDSVAAKYGYAKKEWLEKGFWADHIYHEDKESAVNFCVHASEDGEDHNFEYRFLRADGRPIWVRDIVTVEMKEGKPSLLRGFLVDIDKIKRMELSMSRSRKNLRKAQSLSHIGSWDWNIATGTIYWSNELYRIFGSEPKSFNVNYETVLGFVHPLDKEIAEKNLVDSLEKDKPYDMNQRVILSDGTERMLHVQGEVARDTNGNAVQMFGTAQDITEQKKAEEELRKAKKVAEEATQLKDKFISLVSHDLRGPLGTMMGFINLALHDEEEPQSEGSKLILESAVSSGNEMLNMIEELLNISRLKTGKLVPVPKFLDAHSVVQFIIATMEYKAKNKGITLLNNTAKNSRIYADSSLLTEVLQNLVSNAIKFCSKGDTIRLFTPSDSKTTIAVEDSGKGIAPERIEKIFNYEEKTSTIGTAGESGTGLGLPLSKDIMEAHGGTLTVVSKPKSGKTTFYAKLPFVKPLVMIVDDEAEVRMLHKMYLRKLDIEIIEAEDGVDALEQLEESIPHLILTDIKMPKMDGLELVKSLKSDGRFKKIPIIAITSRDDEETRNNIIQLGCDDFISKPADASELLPRVRWFTR